MNSSFRISRKYLDNLYFPKKQESTISYMLIYSRRCIKINEQMILISIRSLILLDDIAYAFEYEHIIV